jgi:hypothetical protein
MTFESGFEKSQTVPPLPVAAQAGAATILKQYDEETMQSTLPHN